MKCNCRSFFLVLSRLRLIFASMWRANNLLYHLSLRKIPGWIDTRDGTSYKNLCYIHCAQFTSTLVDLYKELPYSHFTPSPLTVPLRLSLYPSVRICDRYVISIDLLFWIVVRRAGSHPFLSLSNNSNVLRWKVSTRFLGNAGFTICGIW